CAFCALLHFTFDMSGRLVMVISPVWERRKTILPILPWACLMSGLRIIFAMVPAGFLIDWVLVPSIFLYWCCTGYVLVLRSHDLHGSIIALSDKKQTSKVDLSRAWVGK